MQSSSRKLLVVLIGLLVLGFVVYRSSGMIHLADFSGTKLLHAVRNANPFLLILSILAIYTCYALRALRWKVFQQNLGSTAFGNDFRDDASRLRRGVSPGARGRAGAAAVAGAKRKAAGVRYVWRLRAGAGVW